MPIKSHGAVKILQFFNSFCRPLSQNMVYTDPAMCTAVFGSSRVSELYKVPPRERTGLDLIRGPHSSHLGGTCHPPWVKQEVWGKTKLCHFLLNDFSHINKNNRFFNLVSFEMYWISKTDVVLIEIILI